MGRRLIREHSAILEEAAETGAETFAEQAARLRSTSPPSTLSAADLIRFDRDRDYDYDPDELLKL